MTANEPKGNEAGPQIVGLAAHDRREELGELTALLQKEPALCRQLLETLTSGRWLITLHAKVKDSPPDDLRHHQTHCKFPVEEIEGSLDQVRLMFASRSRPRPSSKDWR